MFFLLRSAFWLTIVFTSMPPMSGASGPAGQAIGQAVAQQGLAILTAAKQEAVDKATAWCVDKPERCLADAAKLTALISANQSDDLIEPVESAASYPVPRADPRRQGTRS